MQYPDIEEIVAIDLRALRRIFGVISWFVPYQGLERLYREIRAMVLQELDFRAEADNVERIAAHFAGRTDVGFPKVRARAVDGAHPHHRVDRRRQDLRSRAARPRSGSIAASSRARS